MPLAPITSSIRLAATAGLFTMLTMGCWAQEPPSAPTPQNALDTKPVPALEFTKPASHFPNPIAPYQQHHVPEPNLANTSRID